MEEKETVGKQRARKRGAMLIGVGIVLIIVLLGIIAVLLLKGANREEPEETRRNVVVNQSNAEEIADEMINQEYIAPGYYSASMTTTWHFETGDAVSEDAYVANVAENTNDVYFDIFLEGQEEEPIFRSSVIPRGNEIESIKLDKALDAGTYDCVMIYHLVDEDQNTISTLRVGLTIIVEK